MALTSYGYEGSVVEIGWSRLHVDAGGTYGVRDAASWLVSVDGSGDRKIAIALGEGSGKGVTDVHTVTGDGTLTLGSVGAGSRWDLIVARRDWTTNTTTFAVVVGSALRQIPVRATGFGTVDEQPIALCRVEAGKTAVQEIVDLRCWKSGGGLVAMDVLALSYLTAVGTQVTIQGKVWQYVLSPSYVASWVQVNAPSMPLPGTGRPLSGGVISAGVEVKIQAETAVLSSNIGGDILLNFPVPFPNGVLSVVATLVTGYGVPFPGQYTLILWSAGSNGAADKSHCWFRVFSATGQPVPNGVFGISYVAAGW